MAMRMDKNTFNLDLGGGVFVDFDVTPVYNTTQVPRPRPKLIARVVIEVGDRPEGGPPPLELECTFTVHGDS